MDTNKSINNDDLSTIIYVYPERIVSLGKKKTLSMCVQLISFKKFYSCRGKKMTDRISQFNYRKSDRVCLKLLLNCDGGY